jgi:hypothetical protein
MYAAKIPLGDRWEEHIMPSPFPGMDPYLESPELWPEFHDRLLVAIADALGPQLRPRYRVAIEKRVYQDAIADLQIGRPDGSVLLANPRASLGPSTGGPTLASPVMVRLPVPEEVRERFLEVREAGTGKVVTTLEVLSPSNKRSGQGRQVYEEKRLKILGSQTHLVEIDLIRGFRPLPWQGNVIPTAYRIIVSVAEQRPMAALYGFNLADSVPIFPVPLQAKDPPVAVDLQRLIHEVYDRASYDLAIDYSQDPTPALSPSDRSWADGLLTHQGLRKRSEI